MVGRGPAKADDAAQHGVPRAQPHLAGPDGTREAGPHLPAQSDAGAALGQTDRRHIHALTRTNTTGTTSGGRRDRHLTRKGKPWQSGFSVPSVWVLSKSQKFTNCVKKKKKEEEEIPEIHQLCKKKKREEEEET